MKTNIAVVGSGYWGKNLVRNFAELGALHTICDSNATRLHGFGEQYPDVNLEADYHELLGNPDINGIVIATPAVTHFDLACKALDAGKDVFVEKPLALTVSQGEEIVRQAEEKGRVLLVGHLMEYHPAITRLKELIDSGELGKINYIYSNRLNLGKFRTEENILWSFAPHDISVVLLLLGEMPYDISARGGSYLQREITDVTLTTLSFRNGVRAHIFVSWLHPYKEQKLVVVGEKKMAVFDDTRDSDKLVLFNHEIEWIERTPVPRAGISEAIEIPRDEPLKLECQDFLESVAGRKGPRVTGRKGLKVLEVLSFCQRSLEAGGNVITCDTSDRDYFVHETSIVEQPAEIGSGTRVWHFSHIMPDARIGSNCVLGQNSYIGNNVVIGNNVKIENNVSVFEGVTLEDYVFCGPSCVFTNVINPRSAVNRKAEFKPTLVKYGASIGANATIVCGVTIGKHAFIGAGAVVTRDVPDYAMVYGNPARVRGWMCECGAKLEFSSERKTSCASCGKAYEQDATLEPPALRII